MEKAAPSDGGGTVSYNVATEVFEGPFDLLVSLVNRRQVDVMSISLTAIVNDYLGYLERIREMDIEVTSEFLVLAGTLIALKARLLIPGGADDEEEDDLLEERDQLLSRLLACLTFKDVAALLSHRMERAALKTGRNVGIDPPLDSRPPPLPAVSPQQLAWAARRALAPAPEPDLEHLDMELPSVAEALEDVRIRVTAEAASTFDQLVRHCTRRVEVAAYFLAMLELARLGVVSIRQPELFSDILVRPAPGARPAPVAP